MGKALDYAYKLWPRLRRYSLIESCDIVAIEPINWLKDVLEKLRDDTTQEKLKLMLPYYYKETRK